jgi:hypothetical protein
MVKELLGLVHLKNQILQLNKELLIQINPPHKLKVRITEEVNGERIIKRYLKLN